MKLIAPEGYQDFTCIAGACRHTCCKGWEIDIDDAAAQRYKALPGEAGRNLRQWMEEDENGQHFRLLGDEERCPLLMENGLCQLICEVGEDALCQVCRDHPRFRHFMTDRTEIGLGLCCEEAAREQLSRTAPFRLTVLEDDEAKQAGDAAEQAFYRWRENLMDAATDRSMPVAERVENMGSLIGMNPIEDVSAWAGRLLSLEILTEEWGKLLEKLATWQPTHWKNSELEVPSEQLLCALLYRHLSDALEDGSAAGHGAVSLFLWQLCMTLAAMTEIHTVEDLADLARLMSSELEYSQENLDALLTWAEEDLLV